jgi:primosomal protein N' (replication factor Y)
MSTNKLILKIAVPAPVLTVLDYLCPDDWRFNKLQPGLRIQVPFRNKNLIGVLMAIDNKSFLPSKKLKYAIEVMDETPLLDKSILELAQWSANYYHYPIGEVISSCLPKKLREGKMSVIPAKAGIQAILKPLSLDASFRWHDMNEHQCQAVSEISHTFNEFQVHLLHGITGSGKTEVYLRLIEKILEKNGQVLVLVPEIGLTPQTVSRFKERFNTPIAVLHSGLNDRERLEAWLSAQRSIARIIIGTRSAIFTPIPNLALIIIDEEHDASYKQQDNFRYHARDVAIIRAQSKKIPVVMGSATPSLESIHNVKKKNFNLFTLPERAGAAKLPTFKIIDIRNQSLLHGLSSQLLEAIKKHLAREGQILLFINRRGFAPIIICHVCGWCATCNHCDARLVFHKKESKLHCHHCNKVIIFFANCPDCKSKELIPLGLGTERIEIALEKSFPGVGIIRVDRDNTRKKNAFNKIIENINDGKVNIFIGTQMLAKGHHFPKVTLAAIIDIDYGFFSTEMRAEERIGQIITQVAGRAGRENMPGEVLLQTRHPDHPDLQYIIQNNYTAFSENLLLHRKQANLPPYSYHALIRAEGRNKDLIINFLSTIQSYGATISENKIIFLGPVDAPVARISNRQRLQLLMQANSRKILQTILSELVIYISKLKESTKIRWSIDVDPQDFY